MLVQVFQQENQDLRLLDWYSKSYYDTVIYCIVFSLNIYHN